MTNVQNKYSPDIMRTALLPSYGSSIQHKIAEVSDMLFVLQQDRTRDKAVGMLKLAAETLKINGLGRYRTTIGRISYARVVDKAAAADREARKISESFRSLYTGLYKENILLDTLGRITDECINELSSASAALSEHLATADLSAESGHYRLLADNKLRDMSLSAQIVRNSAAIIAQMSAANSTLCESIDSLQVNTLVLWRSELAALRMAPEAYKSEKLERICGIEDFISAAIANMIG